MPDLPKAYDPKAHEKEIYKLWENSGAFKPEVNPDGEPYSIIMPPPNANGSLHLGHAVFVTLEDIMTRFARYFKPPDHFFRCFRQINLGNRTGI
jgi:valyl-tRNA synthetase